MKRTIFLFLLFLTSITKLVAQTGIFAGGPIYYSRDYSIEELRNSCYTHLIVWTIHINQNGDLNFNAEFLICSNGDYVGESTYPFFDDDMKTLKTSPTTIERIEFGLSAWGSSTFDNIRTLIDNQGTGENSILYRNFKALKEAIPEIDAINFDDESTYHAPSASEFSIMLAELGYKVTFAPYEQVSFWQSVATNTNNAHPGAVDAIYLQCYDGGANNNPCTWESYFDNIPVWPGLWDRDDSPAQVENHMNNWQNQCGITGGWMWLYDDFDNTDLTEQYAAAINNALDIDGCETNDPVDCNGVSGGAAFIDGCGRCVEGTTGLSACMLQVDVSGETMELRDFFSYTSADDPGTINAMTSSASLTGNSWKAASLNYSLSPITYLEFDFNGDLNNEINAIGLVEDTVNSAPAHHFQISGSTTWNNSVQNFNNYNGNTAHYKIPVGDYLSGAIQYITFINANNGTGTGNFSNIKIYDEGFDSLLIDFGQPNTPVAAGYEVYQAETEDLNDFTPQSYNAFGKYVTINPSWATDAVNESAQMYDRGGDDGTANPDLLRDWIGTDNRQPGNPLTLTLQGLPTGFYTWESIHHDAERQTGLFNIEIRDAGGISNFENIDISVGNMAFSEITKFKTTIESDGGDIEIVFDQQKSDPVTEAFTVINALHLISHQEIITGLHTNTDEQVLKIYPNPTKNLINISHERQQPVFIRLMDLRGHLIKQELVINKKTLDLSNLESGIYFLQYLGQSKKIIKL